MQFTPYLNFDGNCAEAFAFYAKLFGGTIVYQGTFGEVPASENMPPIPESAKDRIMHVQLQVKEQSLMGSDAMPGADAACGGGYQPPQGLWVSIHATDVAEGRHLFDALAQGGQSVMPFEATFWSPGFGMVKDRFGTPWMVNVRTQS
ncbi:MAG: VOC family protein [Burkholderiaceae bacterium]|nr:VOC family protein [Burkholderiaceae bacterium]